MRLEGEMTQSGQRILLQIIPSPLKYDFFVRHSIKGYSVMIYMVLVSDKKDFEIRQIRLLPYF